MKRACAALLGAAMIVLSPAAASANSGPVRVQASPSYSISPLSDCPVAVAGENLSFDFSSQTKESYSPLAAVTAEYEMKNTASKPQNVRMAFPMIASLSALSRKKGIRIQADGKDLPFRFSIGAKQSVDSRPRAYFSDDGTLDSSVLPSFEEILKGVSSSSGPPDGLTGEGTLYRFVCAETIRLKINLRQKGKSAGILTTGVNGYSQTGSGICLDGLCEPGDGGLSVLVFGDVSRPDVKAYSDAACEKEADAAPQMTVQKQDAAAFLREKLKRTEVYQAEPTEEFLSELTAAALRAAGSCPVAFGDGELYDFLATQRILVLTYEVPFPANGTRQVSVQYPMSGAMNAEKTVSPVYSYGYLLNPAKNWAGFQNLSIRVVPPQKAPYLVQSSIPMTRSQDGSYSVKRSSLPDGDLTFSLYASEKLTQKPAGLRIAPDVLFTLIFAAVLLFAFALVLHACSRRKRG